MSLAEWAPTIVSVVGFIFFGGIAYNKLINHGQQLRAHDEQFAEMKKENAETVREYDRVHREIEKELASTAVKVAKLEAYREGYAEARAIYDRHGKLERTTDRERISA